MNTSNVKRVAPQARQAFMDAVSRRLNELGIYADKIAEAQLHGGLLDIEGRHFEAEVKPLRDRLLSRVAAMGFDPLVENIAYTWFNRFCAIRYMELHDYLGHGIRVLSHPDNPKSFEILDKAELIANDLGLDSDQLIDLKLAGNKDEEIYRKLLLAQCHQLHMAMPFLFEKLDDETELLLPDNLTRTDSILRGLVDGIPEEDWQDIEIIGWLYQFYISEKKDQVIGKVVASVDIPAATQLFTPNWIVKYMVQNSLGAQWLATYPDSNLKGQMEYYIEPAEQTDEVNAQLKEITPTALNPEELTLIDPASGSGHILVEAYELFKDIYLERGYRQRDVPELILEKNLFGLDIDERAAQLTGFALMMKGRADDRRLFERGVKLNVMALVDSAGFDAEVLAPLLSRHSREGGNLELTDLTELKQLFEHATTFGSLIRVPEGLAKKLPALKQLSEASSQDLFVSEALNRLAPLVQQAELLAAQYDAVVTNPPYLGGKAMNMLVRKFTREHFPDAKSDLFACFIERGLMLVNDNGQNAMVTMQSWMFLSSFEKMRKRILREKTIGTLVHLGARAFGSISGEVVQTTVFVLKNRSSVGNKPVFFRLLAGGEDEKRTALSNGEKRHDRIGQEEFEKIPGSPLAYWVSRPLTSLFRSNRVLSDAFDVKAGMSTTDNERFLRFWNEVNFSSFKRNTRSQIDCRDAEQKWYPLNKGGGFRKWYGNFEYVVNWYKNGSEIRDYIAARPEKQVGGRLVNTEYFFKECLTWGDVAGAFPSFRYLPAGMVVGNRGPIIFSEKVDNQLLCYLNSPLVIKVLELLNPTLTYNVGNIASIPSADRVVSRLVAPKAEQLISISTDDWDAYERSWDFQSLPILTASSDPTPTLESSYTAWITQNRDTIAEMKRLEEENNRLFIDAYGLADELTPEVPIKQITLTVNPAYRYPGTKKKQLTEAEQWTRFRQNTCEELVSYAIGCMMGRYSLDAPGLIYANSGNEGFDPGRYPTFPADDDGIIPITDTEWFDDDALLRLIEFISVAWDKAHLQENLNFLAENLSPRKTETSRETIRRYLYTKCFKDHLKTYKKRPIYWMFSSGRQKAFQCLVYLHRYNESTLSRMRTEYVTPLLGKFAAHADQLQNQQDNASTTAEANRFKKELTALQKKQTELRDFDDKLKHYADRRIKLDLDDGVKVNYGKFGDLLAEVKAIHGKIPKVQ